MMPRDRASRLLDEFTAVTDAAPRPDARRLTMRSQLPVATLSAASVIVVVVALAAVVLGRPGPGPAVGSSPKPIVGSSLAPSPAASAPVAVATAPATASPEPTVARCDLAARILRWEGAAGQRIADVELTNRGTTDCLMERLPRPQLVDGAGDVLIDGGPSASSEGLLVLAAGGRATTMVAIGNWCKPEPLAPISVAFVFSSGERLLAAPVSPTDLTLPPCNGATVPATISMHPWAS